MTIPYIDTSALIRLAAGTLSSATILGSSTYLVSSFPVQSDTLQRQWEARVTGGITDGTIIRGLDGSGGLFGLMNGTLTFSWLSQLQLDYLFTTIFQNQYVNSVTLCIYHQRYGTSVINCKMTYPVNLASAGEQSSERIWTNVTFEWDYGTITGGDYSYEYSEDYA